MILFHLICHLLSGFVLTTLLTHHHGWVITTDNSSQDTAPHAIVEQNERRLCFHRWGGEVLTRTRWQHLPPSPRDQVTTSPSLPPPRDQVTTSPSLPLWPGHNTPSPKPGHNTSTPQDQVTTPPRTRLQHLPPTCDQVTTLPPNQVTTPPLPQDQVTTPPSPPRTMCRRAVRIQLECILVPKCFQWICWIQR